MLVVAFFYAVDILPEPLAVILILGILYLWFEREKLKAALKVVTHFCPNCGLLISDKENKMRYCVLCGTEMKNGREKDKLHLVLGGLPLTLNNWRMDCRYNQGESDWINDYAKTHPDDMVAQYYAAMCDRRDGDSAFVEKLKKLSERGFAPAARRLAGDYYLGEDLEKNNVLAQKYCERAAQLGDGEAYYLLTSEWAFGNFQKSSIVKNEEDGLFKGAVRGSLDAIKLICDHYSGQRTDVTSSKIKDKLPGPDEAKLWWLVCAAHRGSAEAVPLIRNCCTQLMNTLHTHKMNSEIKALYSEYEQIMKYWDEKELELQYPNPTCYEAVIAERSGQIEKALTLYMRAAEEDNDENAIEAVRRLTGNKKYMLKAGRLQAEDYRVIYNKAKSLLQSGEYELCLIQARKTLEVYVHNLFFERRVDMPENDDLYNLIKELQNLQMISEKAYNAMDFVRRKGNNAVHGVDKADSEVANRVMDALTQIIENR